jgi:hypothetical protein
VLLEQEMLGDGPEHVGREKGQRADHEDYADE